MSGSIRPDRLRLLLWTLREVAAAFIAALEDALEHPYDKSLLASRREKVRGGG